MADNFTITPGAGGTVRTDDLGTAGHVQYVKLMDGTDGGTSVVSATTAGGLAVLDTGGAYATPTHSIGTVTATAGTVLAANANALYRLIVNPTSGTVWLMLGGSATTAAPSIPLYASGGSYELTKKAGNLYTGYLTAKVASGTSLISIVEGV